ncbi:nitroreductase family protein [Spongiactinospora sp. TRM90649]|uniref:nitroreductase family protein n=1 Tax=Spongiactinospora sp. TRM90649 TaxID=3031114 RepID=UPI0023F987F6|nr:nitroreductase family protein [Spongiactinospora sp. TRM90649]MDF5756344.1 hypothetical protein [Spongiactinospora sp. TRM90649]
MTATDLVRSYVERAERSPRDALASVDWTAAPSLVKRYPRELAVGVPPSLSDLLRRGYGLTRYQWTTRVPGPVIQPGLSEGRPFRPVPAGGGLASSELYLVGAVPGLAVGAYHYDAAAHELTPVRGGATPGDLGVPEAALCLVITGVVERLAFKYGEFAYRLLCLNAGVLAGQLVSVRSDTEPCWNFDGARARVCLGLSAGAESVMAVVRVAGVEPGERPPAMDGTPLSPTARTSPSPVRELARLVTACEATGGHQHPAPHPPALSFTEATRLPDADPRLIDGVEARRTADAGFSDEPLTLADVAALMTVTAGPLLSGVFLLARRVGGLSSGVYCYNAEEHRLLRLGDPRPGLSRALGDGGAALSIYPAGDYQAGFAVAGDRWYTALNIAAGAAAQRCCLASAARGLGCRIQCSYDVETVVGALGMPTGLRPLCQVLVGRESGRLSYTQPLDERHVR